MRFPTAGVDAPVSQPERGGYTTDLTSLQLGAHPTWRKAGKLGFGFVPMVSTGDQAGSS